jgi:hypothetical protein
MRGADERAEQHNTMTHSVRRARLLTTSLPLALLFAACAAPQAPLRPVPAALPEPATRTISSTTEEGTRLALDISPDGRWIVVDLLGQLWRIPAEGGEAVPLTHAVRDGADDAAPAWSPAGEAIAFVADRPGGEALFLLALAGGEVRRLTRADAFAGPDGPPRWAPGGGRLAFVEGR